MLDEAAPKFPGRYWHQTVDLSAHATNPRRPDANGQGQGRRRASGWGKGNDSFLSGEPGPGLELIEHLYAARAALVGADTCSLGPVPREDPERPFLVRQTRYVKMGLFGLENLATEVLVDEKVHESLFVLTHAKTRGSTAAVIAPAALY